MSLNFNFLNILGPYQEKKDSILFYWNFERDVAYAIDMRLSYNDFKIKKFVEENCKTNLCVCMCVCVLSIYEVLFLLNFV